MSVGTPGGWSRALILNSLKMELCDFLVLAKRNAYIGEDSVHKNYRAMDDGCMECVYVSGDFMYRDRYYGNEIFNGREVVFEKKKPIWAMTYHGDLLDPDVSLKDVYNFLGSALFAMNEKFPSRGPKFFSEGRFAYINHLNGSVQKFMGQESILFDNKKVYELCYHGGMVK